MKRRKIHLANFTENYQPVTFCGKDIQGLLHTDEKHWKETDCETCLDMYEQECYERGTAYQHHHNVIHFILKKHNEKILEKKK